MRTTFGLLGLVAIVAITSRPARVAADDPPKFTVKLLAIDTNEGVDVGDINKDGVMDVVAGRAWYAGPDYKPRPVRAIGEFGADYTASNGDWLHDVNGDGWLDVVSIGFKETQLNWYENPGKDGLAMGKLWKQHLLVDTKLGSNEAAWLRDMDGDGAPDFSANSWNAKNAMAYWKIAKDAKGNATATRVTVGESVNGHGQGFGDINGDGREDIVFGGGWYERPAKPGEPWKLHRDFNLPDASCPIIVTDVDGDGRNDLLWGRGHNFGVHWYRQLEPDADGKTKWKDTIIDKSWSQAHALTWADIDGDGKNELITGKRVRAHSGRDPGGKEPPAMYGYRWDAAGKRFNRFTIAEGVGTGLQIRVADMNGDGRADIIVAGKDGTQVLLQQKD